MWIDTYYAPNPSRIEKSVSVLQTVNEPLGGIVTSMPLGTNSYIYTARLTWGGLTELELAELKQAITFLEQNYAYVVAPGLVGTIENYAYPNAMIGTLAPNSTPKFQMEQGSVVGASEFWFYGAEIEIVSQPGPFVVDANSMSVGP